MHTEKIIALVNASIALGQQHRHTEALACLDQAIALNRDFFLLFANKGSVLAAMGRHTEALACFDYVLNLKPDIVQVVQARKWSIDAALAGCDQALVVNPENTSIRYQRGVLLHKLERVDEALACQDAVLEAEPHHIGALTERGTLLFTLNRMDAALACYTQLLALSQTTPAAFAVALFNLANAEQKTGQIVLALEHYRQAAESVPTLLEAKVEQAHCQLRLGNFVQAWPLYESRWGTPQLSAKYLLTPAPQWRGDGSLVAKTILLWDEQGLGDTIQFVRYVAVVAQLAQYVILRVPESLCTVLQTLVGLDGVAMTNLCIISHQQVLPAHDMQCPLMSLPLALGAAFQCIPAHLDSLKMASYLHADEYRATSLNATEPRTIQVSQRGLRIGLVWSGQQHPHNPTRDIPLELLIPLTRLKGEFVSLQKNVSEQELILLNSLHIRCLPVDAMADFAATAAVITQLDLVISVDTAVAHLAAAMGKPTWILLRCSGEWRWMQDRTDSVWYPSVRLFRQSVHGDWDGVVASVYEEIASVSEVTGVAGVTKSHSS